MKHRRRAQAGLHGHMRAHTNAENSKQHLKCDRGDAAPVEARAPRDEAATWHLWRQLAAPSRMDARLARRMHALLSRWMRALLPRRIGALLSRRMPALLPRSIGVLPTRRMRALLPRRIGALVFCKKDACAADKKDARIADKDDAAKGAVATTSAPKGANATSSTTDVGQECQDTKQTNEKL